MLIAPGSSWHPGRLDQGPGRGSGGAAAGATGQAALKAAKHYGATVIATASPGKHETVRALGADHVLDSRGSDTAAEVLRLTGGDLVLESAGGDTFGASLAAAKRVTSRVVVYGLAGGNASITNWELVYKHQIHVIGLNIGVLIQAAPQMFAAVMGELSGLMAAGVLTPDHPTAYELADGPRALMELEARGPPSASSPCCPEQTPLARRHRQSVGRAGRAPGRPHIRRVRSACRSAASPGLGVPVTVIGRRPEDPQGGTSILPGCPEKQTIMGCLDLISNYGAFAQHQYSW